MSHSWVLSPDIISYATGGAHVPRMTEAMDSGRNGIHIHNPGPGQLRWLLAPSPNSLSGDHH